MSNIQDTLEEREKRYGNYLEQTKISHAIMEAIHEEGAGIALLDMAPDKQDAIQMIIVKLARILNGNSDYADNWIDIAGYATLVADRLNKET